jgi:hypothetical protein
VKNCWCIQFCLPQQIADPEDACEPLKAPAVGHAPWIALIIRSQRVHTNCTFDYKVHPPDSRACLATSSAYAGSVAWSCVHRWRHARCHGPGGTADCRQL